MNNTRKNRYRFPQQATNSNNSIYNEYVENMFYEDELPPESIRQKTPRWKKNGRYDIYHTPRDNGGIQQDRRTVAQLYTDRTSRPNG